jgi:O-antigen/teichoic acid export membrane protein
MSEYKLFTQRIGLVAALSLLVSLNAIILLPILTKNIPIVDYGVWIQITVTIGLGTIFTLLGLSSSTVRFLASAKERKDLQEGFYSVFSTVLLTSLVAASLLVLLSEPIAAIFFNDEAEVLKIASIIIIFSSLNEVFLNFFRTRQKIQRYSIFLFIKLASNLLLIAYFVSNGNGILGAVVGYLASEALTCLMMSVHTVYKLGFRIPDFSNIRKYLAFGIFIVPTTISTWVVSSSDRYLIGMFLGTTYVGYYSPGYTLGNMLTMLVTPFSFLLPAVLSKHYDESNMQTVRTLLEYSFKYFLTLAIPSAFGLSLLSKPILAILSTPQIAENGFLITPFTALSALMMGAYSIIYNVLILEKKTKDLSIIWLVAAALNMGLNFIFVPYFGIMGAAMTTLIAYTVAFLAITYRSFQFLRFNIDVIFILKSILASIVMSLLLLQWYPMDKLGILVSVAVGALTYVAVLVMLRGFKKNEIVFFKGLLVSRVQSPK